MAKNLVAVARIVHLVQLRVADARRVLPHHHLEVGRVREINAFNGQRLIGLGKKDHARGSRHGSWS